MTASSNLARTIRIVFIGMIVVLTLYPVVWMFLASTKSNAEIFSGSGLSIGSNGFDNFTSSFEQRPFLWYMVNSLFAAIVSVAITVGLGCTAGYCFSKLKLRFTQVLWLVVLAAIMIPVEAIVIPLYLLVDKFGWINSYPGIVLPTALNAVGIFIIRQAMVSVPDEYIEAARLDGASEPSIVFKIVSPMVAPNIMVAAVLTFHLSWNSYLWPLVVTNDDVLKTLPLGMAAFEKTFYTQYGEIMAVSVFGTIPLLLFFAVFQRYFIEGAANAGLK